jgi:hypothetical protein
MTSKRRDRLKFFEYLTDMEVTRSPGGYYEVDYASSSFNNFYGLRTQVPSGSFDLFTEGRAET